YGPRSHDGTADNHGFRRQAANEVCNANAEKVSRLFQSCTCRAFARQAEIDQLSEVCVGGAIALAGQVLEARERRTFRRKSFPAFATARCARHRRALANRHVAKLTCRAVFTAIDLAIENDSGADTTFDEYQNEISDRTDLRPAKPELSLSRCIRVVVHCDRQSGGCAYFSGERNITPVKSGNE